MSAYKKIDEMIYVVTFIISMAFWFALAGIPDFVSLTLGIISSIFVSLISGKFLFGNTDNVKKFILRAPRMIGYFFFYLKDITLANIDVAYRVLHPKMPIDPCIIEYETKLKSDFGITVAANSITITPGTVTVDIVNGKLFVHAIVPELAESIVDGELDSRIMRFAE